MDVLNNSFFLIRYLTTVLLFILIMPVVALGRQRFITEVGFSYQKNEDLNSKSWDDRFQQDYNTSHYGYLFHPRIFPLQSKANFSTSKIKDSNNDERKLDNYYFSTNTTILPTTRYPVNLNFSHNLNKNEDFDQSMTSTSAQWNLKFDYFPSTNFFFQNQSISWYGATSSENSYGFSLLKNESKEVVFGRTRFSLLYSGVGGGTSSGNQASTVKNGSASNSLNFSSATKFSSRSSFEQGFNYNTSEYLVRNRDGSTQIGAGSQNISYNNSLNLRPTPYLTQQYGYNYSLTGFGAAKNVNHNGNMSVNKILSSRLSTQFSSSYMFGSSDSSLGEKISESTSSFATAGARLKITNHLGSGYSLFYRNAESKNESSITGLTHSKSLGTNASLNYRRVFFDLLSFSNSLSGAIANATRGATGLEDSETKDTTISNGSGLGIGKRILGLVMFNASGSYSVTKGNHADIMPAEANLNIGSDSKSHGYNLKLKNIVLNKSISITGDYGFNRNDQTVIDQNGETISGNFEKIYKLDIRVPYFTSLTVSGDYNRKQKSSISTKSEDDSQYYNVNLSFKPFTLTGSYNRTQSISFLNNFKADLQEYIASFSFTKGILGGELSTQSNYIKRDIETYISENLATTINYKRRLTRFMFGHFNVIRNDTWLRGLHNIATAYNSRLTYQLRRWKIGFTYEYTINQNNNIEQKNEHTYFIVNITRTFSRFLF